MCFYATLDPWTVDPLTLNVCAQDYNQLLLSVAARKNNIFWISSFVSDKIKFFWINEEIELISVIPTLRKTSLHDKREKLAEGNVSLHDNLLSKCFLHDLRNDTIILLDLRIN